MEEMATIRRAHGLSFRELGQLAGTSAATLNAYERGRISPTWTTFQRVARSAGFEPVIDLVDALPTWAYPVEQLVDDLRDAPEPDRLRHAVEFSDRWHETPADQRRLLIHGDPGSTDQPRWDALVGGLVEHLCWHDGMTAPPWVGDPTRFLDGRWWPVDLPSLRSASLAAAPASFARRGVMLDRSTWDRA